MELWIRSQNKENLVKVNYLYLTDFNNRYGVYGETINSNAKLGYYKSKERALEVLDKIQKHIEKIGSSEFLSSDNGISTSIVYYGNVYQMPKE